MANVTSQINTREFIEKTREDISGNSPTTTSFFNKRLPQFKHTINSLDTSIDLDRDNLIKMKKALKAMSINVNAHLENETNLSKVLKKLGASSISREEELEIGQAFIKFSIVASELSTLIKTLMQNLSNRVIFPLETMLKSDLKSINGDLKRPVDKALSDYESRLAKLEKDKKKKTHHSDKTKDNSNALSNSHQQRNQTSYQTEQPSSIELLSTDSIDPTLNTVADKEKRIFQLHLCDYLIRVNDIKTRKGVDLLQHLVEHFNAQATFFREGLKTIEHYQSYISELSQRLVEIRIEQDDERRSLVELRNNLKTSAPYLDINSGGSGSKVDTTDSSHDNTAASYNTANDRRDSSIHGYSLHQLQGNLSYGFNKSGYLLKKSEGKMRVKAWHKRRCDIIDGFMCIYHSDETKTPTKLNLLTCQVKPVVGEEKKCFDLISYNRTYHFQVEDEADLTAWVSVLINCKEGALKREFDNSHLQQQQHLLRTYQVNISPGGSHRTKKLGNQKQNIIYIQQNLIGHVRTLPGNHRCVDCSTTSSEPTWLSTNLGVLVCIECSGIHRDLGVQISRIQSLTLDKIGTSQLLIAYSMGNDVFNEVFEAQLNEPTRDSMNETQKLKPNSSMDQRCEFIRAKYMHRKFCSKINDDEAGQLMSLKKAILDRDLKHLLQIFGEGFDLSSYLNNIPPQNVNSSGEKLIARQNSSPDAPVDLYLSSDLNDTSLHLAICSQCNQATKPGSKNALHILDFIIQNSRTLNRQNNLGETALHYCVKYNQPESMKLLLRAGAEITIKDSSGATPIDVARSGLPGSEYLVELLEQASQNKKAMFENVHFDWSRSFSTATESSCDDSSDDEQVTTMDKSRSDRSQAARNTTTLDRSRKSLKDSTDNAMSKQRQAQRRIANEVAEFHAKSAEKKKAQITRFRSSDSGSPLALSPSTPSTCTTPCDENDNSAVICDTSSPISSINRSHVRTPSDPIVNKILVNSQYSNVSPCSDSMPSQSHNISSLVNPPSSPQQAPLSSASSTTSSSNHRGPPRVFDNHGLLAGNQHKPQISNRVSPPNSNPGQQLVTIALGGHKQKSAPTIECYSSDIKSSSNINNKCSQNGNTEAGQQQQLHTRTSTGSIKFTHQLSSFKSSPKGRYSSLDSNNSPYDCAYDQYNQNSNSKSSRARDLPIPPPRKRATNDGASFTNPIRARALFPCKPDRDDELGFEEGEIIAITSEQTADRDWWQGYIDGQPERHGVFPAIFVKILRD